MIGKSISQYQVTEKLGAAGMGRLQCKSAAYSNHAPVEEDWQS
jgi:hypothetical protein